MSKKSKVSVKKEKDKHKSKKPQKKVSKSPAKKDKPAKSAKTPAKKAPVKKAPPKKTKPAPKSKLKAKSSKTAAAVKGKTLKNIPKQKAVSKKAASKGAPKPLVKPTRQPISKPVVKAAHPSSASKNRNPVQTAKASSKTKPEVQKAPLVKSAISKPEVSSKVPKTKDEKPQKPAQQSVFHKADKKVPDVMAVQNTLPVKTKQEISASKIASISQSITNPVRKTDSYSVKAEKEPAGKFEMEFVIHSSAEMLYEFLSTPSGLSEWFCDDLNIRNGIYTFIWEDQLMQARLLKTSDLQLVRFQWVDKTDGSYFEFRIQKDDLTNDISLIITDFAETAAERESAKLLWQSQIEKLRHVIGSIF